MHIHATLSPAQANQAIRWDKNLPTELVRYVCNRKCQKICVFMLSDITPITDRQHMHSGTRFNRIHSLSSLKALGSREGHSFTMRRRRLFFLAFWRQKLQEGQYCTDKGVSWQRLVTYEQRKQGDSVVLKLLYSCVCVNIVMIRGATYAYTCIVYVCDARTYITISNIQLVMHIYILPYGWTQSMHF